MGEDKARKRERERKRGWYSKVQTGYYIITRDI